jgi:heme A synthase
MDKCVYAIAGLFLISIVCLVFFVLAVKLGGTSDDSNTSTGAKRFRLLIEYIALYYYLVALLATIVAMAEDFI